jgi:hypothetical protein
MMLNNGDTVIVQNTSPDGKLIDEGFARIIKPTKQIDMYMVKFIDHEDEGLFLRFVPDTNKV